MGLKTKKKTQKTDAQQNNDRSRVPTPPRQETPTISSWLSSVWPISSVGRAVRVPSMIEATPVLQMSEADFPLQIVPPLVKEMVWDIPAFNIDWQQESKPVSEYIVQPSRYIDHALAENLSFLTPSMLAAQGLSGQFTTNEGDAGKASHTEIPYELKAKLSDQGYTANEINALLELGATPAVLQKLIDKDEIDLTAEDSVNCIETLVSMGNKQAEKSLGLDLVLVIGMTGVGKSTAINYLHGCQMDTEMKKRRKVVRCANGEEEVAKIGHGASKTLVPTIIPSEPNIIFCDCPGFNDQRGAEIDIANAVNIKNVIKQAKTAKILVLIKYSDAIDVRRAEVNRLMQILGDLFGLSDVSKELPNYADNIVIGITHTPSMIFDCEPMKLEDVIQNIYDTKGFPEVFRDRILILDPLNMISKNDCSHSNWIDKIKHEMQPFENPSEMFQTVLSADNERKLIEISKKISEKINQALTVRDYDKAYRHLKNIASLQVIGRSEIMSLLENAIQLINNQFATSSEHIKLQCLQQSFRPAADNILILNKVCALFEEFSPDLRKSFIKLTKFYEDKYLDASALSVANVQEKFKDRLLNQEAYLDKYGFQFWLLIQKIDPEIKADIISRHLNDVLNVLSTWEGLSAHAKILNRKLRNHATVCKAFQRQDDFEATEMATADMLITIALEAKQHHDYKVKQALLDYQIKINENIDELVSLCVWEPGGQDVLDAVRAAGPVTSVESLKTLTIRLTQVPHLADCATKLHDNLTTLCTLTLQQENSAQADGVIAKFHDKFTVIINDLIRHKNDALAAEHGQKEQRLVEGFVSGLRHIIEEKDLNEIGRYIVFADQLTEDQIRKIKEYEDFKFPIARLLNDYLTELESLINWKDHKAVMQNILFNASAQGLSQFEQVFTGGPANVAGVIKKVVQMNGLASMLDRRLSSSNAASTSSSIAVVLNRIIEKLQQDFKREESERLQLEAQKFVTLINNEYLPKHQFDQINRDINHIKEISRQLAVIAQSIPVVPCDFIGMIPLKIRAEEFIRLFLDNLNARNYRVSVDNLNLLKKMKKKLGAVLEERAISIDLATLHGHIEAHVRERSQDAVHDCRDALSAEKVKDLTRPIHELKKIGVFFDSMANFKKVLNLDSIHADSNQAIINALEDAQREYTEGVRAEIYARFLMQAQILIDEIGPRDANLNTQLVSTLMADTQRRGHNYISAVGNILINKMEGGGYLSRSASELIARYQVFAEARAAKFIEETKKRESLNILADLAITNKESLEAVYRLYDNYYDEHIYALKLCGAVKTALDLHVNKVIRSALDLGKLMEHKTRFDEEENARKIASMLAGAAAVWSYYQVGGNGITDGMKLRKPHSAQVIAVFILLGMNSTIGMRNHIVQVLTGEGKSVIIAFTSLVLSMIGYRINVACYNPYLAQRDEKAFKLLFKLFNNDKNINFQDLSILANNYMAEKIGDMRDLVARFLKGERIDVEEQVVRKTVLILDEADVPFSDKFVGSTYGPVTDFYIQSYHELLQFIWSNRQEFGAKSEQEFIASIKAHPLMTATFDQHVRLKALEDGIVKEIYSGFRRMHNNWNVYECHNGKIGYRNEVANTIEYNIRSSATAFAAIEEARKGNITPENLKTYARLVVTVGNVSYSLLLKSFDHILGVSGTLPSSSVQQRLLREDYQIQNYTRLPSVFEKTPIQIDDITICAGDLDENKEGRYFHEIQKKIEECLSNDKAALVVFADEARLKQYQLFTQHNTYRLSGIREDALTIDVDHNLRDQIIMDAATKAKVTLMVKEYGRGSDFVCHDTAVKQAGGVMVINTFFPDTITEETQIKGRTCRQNDPGSYVEILYLPDLKKFDVNTLCEFPITSVEKRQYLERKRAAYNERQDQRIEQSIQSARDRHEDTVRLFNKLKPGAISGAIERHAPDAVGSLVGTVRSRLYDVETIALIKKLNGW